MVDGEEIRRLCERIERRAYPLFAQEPDAALYMRLEAARLLIEQGKWDDAAAALKTLSRDIASWERRLHGTQARTLD